jgi:hypothetical protein
MTVTQQTKPNIAHDVGSGLKRKPESPAPDETVRVPKMALRKHSQKHVPPQAMGWAFTERTPFSGTTLLQLPHCKEGTVSHCGISTAFAGHASTGHLV